MWRGPVAGRRHVDLAWIGLGVGDELGDRLGRNRWIDHHDVGHAHDARDRRDVGNEIEIELVVERCVDRVRRSHQQQRIAVRRRAHDRLGPDIAAGARPVLDDEWLAEPLRQPLTDEARDDVGRAAGGESRRSYVPAASDRFPPSRSAKRPGARQRPLPDAEILRGSFILPSRMRANANRRELTSTVQMQGRA